MPSKSDTASYVGGARDGVETVLLAIDILLAAHADGENVRTQLSQRVGLEQLHEAAQTCREVRSGDSRKS